MNLRYAASRSRCSSRWSFPFAGNSGSFNDSNHPGTLFSSAVYNAPGQLTSDQLGNGITETRAYNPRLWMTSLAAGSAYNLSMTSHAPNGDILSANDSANGNWTYTYDDFNRLASANATGQAYTYAYDRFGNRWQQNGPHTMMLTFSGANNRMDGYSYDAAGNVLNDGVHTYIYDAENRIVTVDGSATTYVYDADGRRVRKTVGGASTDYVYDLAGHSVAEANASGWQRGEVYASGRHLATYANNTTYFDHGDWVATERVRTAVNGSVCESITSLPFGDGESTTGSCADVSTRHFTGKERDSESGLDNFGARYNSSAMGRFMSPDPMFMNDHHLYDPQELNLYSYVRNNPLSLTDPTGLDLWLKGCGKDTATCHKGYVGSWDKDHKHFTRTHLSGDLTNSATLDRRGVTVKYNGGSYQGVWDTNKGENNAAQVAGGGGALNGFTATINGNCSNTCVVSGFLSVNGNNAVSGPAMSALGAPGSGYQRNAGFDSFDVFHKSDGSFDINFRGYLPDDPEGLPSTHIPVPNQPGQDVGFHVDGRYPYEDAVGFAEHTGSVVKTIIQTIAPPKTPQ